MNSLAALNTYSYSIVILFMVIGCKVIISRAVPHQPMNFFRFYCTQLANKVNKTSNSINQQTIAGFVAIVITLPPIFIILWLFADFIEVPWLWQGFLLYLALDGLSVSKTSTSIAQAINIHDNEQAKKLLSPFVLRDTELLSSLGLSKTTIEMQLLHTLQQLFCVGFFFIAIGPLAALSFRLLLEMHYCWNVKQTNFRAFGKAINNIIQLLQWLPVRIFALCLLIANLSRNIHIVISAYTRHFFTFNNSIAIAVLAYNVNIQLAGVAMYKREKLRRPSVNKQGIQPTCQDILISKKAINQSLIFIASALILSATAMELSL